MHQKSGISSSKDVAIIKPMFKSRIMFKNLEVQAYPGLSFSYHFLPKMAAILRLLSARDPLVLFPPTGLDAFTFSPVNTILLLFVIVYSRFGPLAYVRGFEEE